MSNVGRAILLLAVLTFAAVVCAEVRYTVTDLGTLGGRTSYVGGINERGQIVGWSETGVNQPSRAFRWDPGGGMVDLGALATARGSVGMAISNDGRAVGYCFVNSVGRGFRTAPDSVIDPVADDIGSLTGSSGSVFTHDVNANGCVVGTGKDGFGWSRAILYDGSQVVSLGEKTLTAYGINDQGVICGEAWTDTGDLHAFLVPPGRDVDMATDDLGTLGGNQSEAYDLNEAGHVVGMAKNRFRDVRPFLYRYGRMEDLGTAGGPEARANAVNNHDQVVGWSDTSVLLKTAFLWEWGRLWDLNELIPANSGWYLEEAKDINDLGQIVGHGTIQGQVHAFLLDPLTPPRHPGDSDGDGRVDFLDALALTAAWGSGEGDPLYDPNVDFNSDGTIDLSDAFELNQNWGWAAEPPPPVGVVPEPAGALLLLGPALLLQRMHRRRIRRSRAWAP